MNNYLRDVLNQPDSLRKALSVFIDDERLKIINELTSKKFDKILFTGMGSSHFCCYGASAHLNQCGFTSIVKPASQVLHYEPQLINDKTLLFLVSQSGESVEIVNLIKIVPDNCVVVAITNNPDSALAKRGNYTFILNVNNEESVTTRTYLASVLLVNIIAKSMTGHMNDCFINDLYTAIDKLENFLIGYKEFISKINEFFSLPPYLCLIGRGFSRSTVDAGALFIREVVKYPCINFDSGEFRHGPFEMVDENFNGIIFAPQGVTYDLNCKMAYDIAYNGGRVMLITNGKNHPKHENILIIELELVDEFLFSLVEIAPIQLLAYNMAEIRGFEVGKFRWGSKVTTNE